MTRSGDENPGYLLLLGDCTCHRGFDQCSNSVLCVFLRLRYVFPRRCWVKMTREIRILTQPSTRTFKPFFWGVRYLIARQPRSSSSLCIWNYRSSQLILSATGRELGSKYIRNWKIRENKGTNFYFMVCQMSE